MDVNQFWGTVLSQDRAALRGYFADDAYINWHCTNEHFTVEEYIKANCDYPGEWDGEVERIERTGNLIITVTRVFPQDKSSSFHVVSFIHINNERIQAMDEYWADDGDAPLWRRELKIGEPIR